MEAIADNRPLYFFVNRAKVTVMRIAQMLQLAMNYSNEEGASDKWVNELVHKELEKQGITVNLPTEIKQNHGRKVTIKSQSD